MLEDLTKQAKLLEEELKRARTDISNLSTEIKLLTEAIKNTGKPIP